MTTADTALMARAATLEIRKPANAGERTWQVQSASTPGKWYIVRGTFGDDFDELTCSCQGAKGRCAHRIRLARRLNIEVPDAAARRRPATQTPTSSSLQGAAVVVAAAPTGESDDTGGSMDEVGVFGTKVIVIGAIADRATAVQASGKIEGGANLSLDIPDDEHLAEIIGTLTAMRRMPLRITIEPLPTSKESDHANR